MRCLLLCLCLLLPSLATAGDEMEFTSYSFVVLRAGPAWSDADTPENVALQAAHIAHLTALFEQGHVLVCGPFSDQEDASIRGICLYSVPLDEARRLAEEDPRVQAGHLTVEVMTWWMQADALAFPASEAVLGGGEAEEHGGHHGGGEHGGHHDGGDGPTVTHRFDDAERWAAVFDDPGRDEWQKPVDLVAALDIGKGDTVADIGAGTGYFNPHLAKAVGGKGRVIAVDIEPNLVVHMALRALEERTFVVEPRLGAPDDPGLAEGEADVVLLVDTYHHIGGRIDYFTRLKAAMKSGGRLVVVDFREGDLPVGPPPKHRIPVEQVTRELAEAGWIEVEAIELLPYQFVRVYRVARSGG